MLDRLRDSAAYSSKLLPGKDELTVKKLLAMALIGGLFSLGCTENTTKPEPKKDKMPPSKMKTMGEGKDDATPKVNGKAKDEADKKDEKKDETPKKDADKKDKK
jgi:hypothetical protein